MPFPYEVFNLIHRREYAFFRPQSDRNSSLADRTLLGFEQTDAQALAKFQKHPPRNKDDPDSFPIYHLDDRQEKTPIQQIARTHDCKRPHKSNESE
jgi:hypothetical protein